MILEATLSCIWLREALVTFSALECLFCCVGSLMFLQVIWPENFLPHFVHKNCFSPVWFSLFSSHLILRSFRVFKPFVSLQSECVMILESYVTKRSIVTFGALERLLSCVSPFVKYLPLRVILCFFTLSALKLFLSFVVPSCLKIHQIPRRSCCPFIIL